MRKLVIGDIHGNYQGMLEALEHAKFDQEKDLLISLGDIVDGQPHTAQVIEFLRKVPNFIGVRGNHDQWAIQWYQERGMDMNWYRQGGLETIASYHFDNMHEVKEQHLEFLEKQKQFYIDEENRAFVHAGYYSQEGLGHDTENAYYWDRDLWNIALSGKVSQQMPKILRPHKEIFIGHTTTMIWGTTEPMKACNVWNLDTGAGYSGKVTVMDVDTKEYWQSQMAKEYGYNGR